MTRTQPPGVTANSNLECNVRARVDIGFGLKSANGWCLFLGANYDGMGSDAYEAAGGKVQISKRL